MNNFVRAGQKAVCKRETFCLPTVGHSQQVIYGNIETARKYLPNVDTMCGSDVTAGSRFSSNRVEES